MRIFPAGVDKMQASNDFRPPKKSVNLSINSELLLTARELDINVSAILETALTEAVKQKQRERWLAENRSAIAAYNERVDARGVFSDGLRKF